MMGNNVSIFKQRCRIAVSFFLVAICAVIAVMGYMSYNRFLTQDKSAYVMISIHNASNYYDLAREKLGEYPRVMPAETEFRGRTWSTIDPFDRDNILGDPIRSWRAQLRDSVITVSGPRIKLLDLDIAYIIYSFGPDCDDDLAKAPGGYLKECLLGGHELDIYSKYSYDPSNGTVSDGDILTVLRKR